MEGDNDRFVRCASGQIEKRDERDDVVLKLVTKAARDGRKDCNVICRADKSDRIVGIRNTVIWG